MPPPNINDVISQFGNLPSTVFNFGSGAASAVAEGLRWRPFPLEEDAYSPQADIAALEATVQQVINGDLPPLPSDMGTFTDALQSGQDVGSAVQTATGGALADIGNFLSASAQFGEQEMVDFIANDMQGKAQTAAREIMETHPELGLIDTALSPADFTQFSTVEQPGGQRLHTPDEQFQLAEAEASRLTKAVYDKFGDRYGVDPELIKMYVGREKQLELDDAKLRAEFENMMSKKASEAEGTTPGRPLWTPGETYDFLRHAINGEAYTDQYGNDMGMFSLEGASSMAVQQLVAYWESLDKDDRPLEIPVDWTWRQYANYKVNQWGGIYGPSADEHPPPFVDHPLSVRPEDSLRGFISQIDMEDRGAIPGTDDPYMQTAWSQHLNSKHNRIMSEGPKKQHLFAAKNTLGSYANTAQGEANINTEYRNSLGKFILTVAMEGGWNPLESNKDIMFFDWSRQNMSPGGGGAPLSEEEKAIMAKNWSLIAHASKDQRLLSAKMRSNPEKMTRAEMIAVNPTLEMAAAVAMYGGGEADLGPQAKQKQIAFKRMVNNHNESMLNLPIEKQTGVSWGLSQLRGGPWQVGFAGERIKEGLEGKGAIA